MNDLKDIPCNVITGFLGSGKTTAILHLLKQKPEHERWAVLVNEFGKTGIDGKVIAMHNAHVKEIPGGCMCCSAGMPMQVALNQLIKQSRPHRLLIEPSGAGHPRQVIKQLSIAPFDRLLDMRACITLLNPTQLKDRRYTGNTLSNDQIRIADVLVANKTDLCDKQDQQHFIHYLEQLKPEKLASGWLQQGQLDAQWLDLPHHSSALLNIQAITGVNSNASAESEFYSYSKEFTPDTVFSYPSIMVFISQLKAERVKALLKTDQGDVFINSTTGNSSTIKVSALSQSHIEIIQQIPVKKADISQQLANCIQSP